MGKARASDEFLRLLEKGIREVLSDPESKPSEKIAAIVAGSKLLMIEHKISETDEASFFK
jgi:hypothetical protein